MKKYLVTFIMMAVVVGLMPLMIPITAEAQQKVYARRVVNRNGREFIGKEILKSQTR